MEEITSGADDLTLSPELALETARDQEGSKLETGASFLYRLQAPQASHVHKVVKSRKEHRQDVMKGKG